MSTHRAGEFVGRNRIQCDCGAEFPVVWVRPDVPGEHDPHWESPEWDAHRATTPPSNIIVAHADNAPVGSIGWYRVNHPDHLWEQVTITGWLGSRSDVVAVRYASGSTYAGPTFGSLFVEVSTVETR